LTESFLTVFYTPVVEAGSVVMTMGDRKLSAPAINAYKIIYQTISGKLKDSSFVTNK